MTIYFHLHMADDVDEKDEDLEEGVEQPAIGQLLPGYGAHSLSLSLSLSLFTLLPIDQ